MVKSIVSGLLMMHRKQYPPSNGSEVLVLTPSVFIKKSLVFSSLPLFRCVLYFSAMGSSSSSPLRKCLLFLYMLCFLRGTLAYIGRTTVSSTVLIFARDTTSAKNGAALGLCGYGIPYEITLVPQTGITDLPLLNSSGTHGNYGGIVIVSEVAYNYDNQYRSALTEKQWNELYAYQSNFGTRMVRIDVYPTTDFGVSSVGSNLNDEPVSFTNTTAFATANLKT